MQLLCLVDEQLKSEAMTQIVTISPSTAAYAAQGMKTSLRSSTLFEQKMQAWSEQAKSTGDAQQKALLTVVTPPALVLALLTMSRQQPVGTEMALRAYVETSGEAE